MPLYDALCPSCKKRINDLFKRMRDPFPVCDCGVQMQNVSAPAVHVWDSDAIFEHVADEPMRFKSQKELKYYCRENGMVSQFAEGCP